MKSLDKTHSELLGRVTITVTDESSRTKLAQVDFDEKYVKRRDFIEMACRRLVDDLFANGNEELREIKS